MHLHQHLALSLGLAVLSIAVLAGTASADSQVTAEWNVDVPAAAFGSFGGTGFSQARGQTFEATVDGRVETIELRLARGSDHDEPIIIELFDVDATDKPVGGALMSETFPATDIPINAFATPTVFAFAAGAVVTAGQRYAITLRPQTLDPSGNSYVVNGGVNDDATYEQGSALRSADAGASWVVETITDWAFRVIVDAPTPVEEETWGAVKSLFR